MRGLTSLFIAARNFFRRDDAPYWTGTYSTYIPYHQENGKLSFRKNPLNGVWTGELELQHNDQKFTTHVYGSSPLAISDHIEELADTWITEERRNGRDFR